MYPATSAVRLAFTGEDINNIWAGSIAAAQQIGMVEITDDRGERHIPFGYVWDKGGELEINVDPVNLIDRASELPLRQVSADQTLYLYFRISPQVTLKSYQIGERYKRDINVRLNQ